MPVNGRQYGKWWPAECVPINRGKSQKWATMLEFTTFSAICYIVCYALGIINKYKLIHSFSSFLLVFLISAWLLPQSTIYIIVD
jgi:hypothetical protein